LLGRQVITTRRLILGVALLVLIGGAAALGFAAGGHATSKRSSRNIELHFGDHLFGNAIKVSCGYSLGPHEQRPNLYCFGPSRRGSDPELIVEWTRGAVQVTRCWNDCVKKEDQLFTARR
jgi:hypothetical protein